MNKKGFTLVELVVVIAIIGVLAAILIPTMMSYIKKAKLKSANSNAKIVFNTVNAVVTDMQCEGKILMSALARLLLIAPPSLTLQKNLKKLSMMHLMEMVTMQAMLIGSQGRTADISLHSGVIQVRQGLKAL